DAGILSGLESPGQTVLNDRAAPTDCLGLLDLKQRRPGVSDREEEFGVFVTADCAMPPVHGFLSPHSARRANKAVPDRTCACESFHERVAHSSILLGLQDRSRRLVASLDVPHLLIRARAASRL